MSLAESDQKNVWLARIKQVFEFLKELNNHRNPAVRQVREHPWHFWLDQLPDHHDIELRSVDFEKDGGEEDVPENSTVPQYLFRVRRPKLTPPPSPPIEIIDWLKSGWNDPDQEVTFHELKNQTDRDGGTRTIHFIDSSDRPLLFAAWKQKRDKWRQAEIPARLAMEIFEKLYALHGKLDRESEAFDLVIGDGLLSWQQADGSIYHPLIIQRVQLGFDPKVPEFRIVDADAACELYTTVFQTVPEVDPAMLASARKELQDGGFHPLSPQTSGFLQSFVNRISAQGLFVPKGRPDQGSEQSAIGRAPLLFLRSRTKGYGNAIEQVLNSIESRGDFCEALRNIVGCETASPNDGSNRPVVTEADVLFGKKYNAEQFRIAQQLDRHGSVLVQGPPGTGKSHTIANLIGHLLANGKSVLVTSHTTKALRVLRDHVVENLRPLCVSVLESDLESREQLKQSVLQIAGRLAQSDHYELERQADILNHRRKDLLELIRRTQEDLRRARADEYREIVWGGIGVSPSVAARKVAEGRGRHDWIPAPIALGETLPLSTHEIKELYATNASTFAEDDRLAQLSLPSLDFIPSLEDFSVAVQAKEPGAQSSLWQRIHDLAGKDKQIEGLIEQFRQVVAEFNGLSQWQLAAVDAGRKPATRQPWEELLRRIDKGNRFMEEGQSYRIEYSPQIGSEPPIHEQIKVAKEIQGHLDQGGKIFERQWVFRRGIRKSWAHVYSAWTVKDRHPETPKEFSAVFALLNIQSNRTKLQQHWDGLIACNGGQLFEDFHEDPEGSTSQFTSSIIASLNWWNDRWRPLVQELQSLGFDWDQFLAMQPPKIGKQGEMNRCISAAGSDLISELGKTVNRIRGFQAEEKLEAALKRLEQFVRPEAVELRRAILSEDPRCYQVARENCTKAVERQKTARRRSELLKRLRKRNSTETPIADEWANSISNRIGLHAKSEPPGDIEEAWTWRQLNDELDRRTKTDTAALGKRLEELNEEVRRIANELIDQRAWAAQVLRTSLRQRQALIGWSDTVKRIGKGYVKRAPHLRREAQRLMEECRSAVPVWIMPLVRLADSFDFGKPCFDVVVIDEASQCDVMALLALALAKDVVIVGDDEQVSPLAVGQRQDFVEQLIKIHLQGIRNSHLYDGQMSIYDLAKQSFAGVIRLLEHFRCVPDIIQYSNFLCYQGEIKPLREEGNSPIRPHVVPYRVEGVCDSKNVNEEEVWTIATLLAAAIEHPEYREMTFGVISLLGDEQAYEIEKLLLKNLSPEEYQRHRIICGNSAQFQGDERDVMFLSMVYSPEDDSLLRILDRKAVRQRFNVAASRAKNQMWLIYSVDPALNLKPGDLRRRLIEHILDPGAVTRDLKLSLARTQSEFERLVLRRLVQAGYRVHPQWPVGNYRIDLVVEGAGRRLAVECDGDRYHPIEKLPEDMERQAVLERLGWRFLRIRGSSFFRDPENTMNGVFKKLEELEIPPEGPKEEKPDDESSLVSELKRRASEIRAEWKSRLATEREGENVASAPQKQQGDKKQGDIPGSTPESDKKKPEWFANAEIRRQTTLFPIEGEDSRTKKPQPSVVSPPSPSNGPNDLIEADRLFKKGPGSLSIDGLLSMLDQTIFPAVAGTEPRGSRRLRLERWRTALISCSYKIEELVSALGKSDPAILIGKDGTKVRETIKRWINPDG